MNLSMNSDEVFDLIESIAATASKNAKESMLKACASSDFLREVLKATYDPTISYGIRAVPERQSECVTGKMFDARTWAVISQMRDRTLTGNLMLDEVAQEMRHLSEESAELFKRIILKDMKAGFSENTTNKAFPGLVPDFPYMRCCLPKDAKLDKFDWVSGVISQEKADGMFANIDHEASGEVFIYSRQGTMFPMEKFGHLEYSVQRTLDAGTQTHGEILVTRGDLILPREIGNGILNSVLKGGEFGPNEKAIVLVWDQIPLEAVKPKGKYEVPYRARLMSLIRQLKRGDAFTVVLVPTKIVYSLAEAYQHYAELLLKGKEGTVIKYHKAIWRDGTSKEQVKLKLEFVVDLQIQEIVPGKANGKNEGKAGSLKCATADGLLVVDVTVKNEAMRALVDAKPEDWIGRVIEVLSTGVMKPSGAGPHSLFLPRMVEACYRLDKTTPDTLDRVFAQEEAAKQGADILKEAA